jgi:hypothetical protein
MSAKRTVGKAVMAPLVAAGTSLATRYVVKKGPEFVEETFLPWLRETAQGAGVTDTARSAMSSGSDLAEQLTDRARDVTGFDSGSGDGDGGSSRLSQDELSSRSEERAKRRAQRRKATKKK